MPKVNQHSYQFLDEKVTACVVGESGVPSESKSADCVGGSTVHLTADTNSCVSKDEHNAVPTQQEDNGRSDGSSNKINIECSTDNVKGNNIACMDLYCMWVMQYLVNTIIVYSETSHNGLSE